VGTALRKCAEFDLAARQFGGLSKQKH